MDDDKEKSIVEKTVQTVKDIASTVSDAAKHAMEPEPLKPGGEAVTYTRMAGDGVVSDPVMAPFVVISPRKKSTSKKAPKTTVKTTVKKTAEKSAKIFAKKAPAKKAATKTTKKAATKSAAKKSKKTAKKSSVRSAKKAKRKSKK
ncbi:MAG: histidine biosynthesis protein HisIE [Bradyrhizobium sp.]|uniref:hypothetical protein n=1 Tax=Bradyrhizobium sp. TaxID=376 RepID=UPI001218D07A|nr:hypothetical protein [Bradyrhizobium sp.]THD57111.1 MAG: histidine biosynthesis protein HisIE [Bradyrhizobium sp.]